MEYRTSSQPLGSEATRQTCSHLYQRRRQMKSATEPLVGGPIPPGPVFGPAKTRPPVRPTRTMRCEPWGACHLAHGAASSHADGNAEAMSEDVGKKKEKKPSLMLQVDCCSLDSPSSFSLFEKPGLLNCSRWRCGAASLGCRCRVSMGQRSFRMNLADRVRVSDPIVCSTNNTEKG